MGFLYYILPQCIFHQNTTRIRKSCVYILIPESVRWFQWHYIQISAYCYIRSRDCIRTLYVRIRNKGKKSAKFRCIGYSMEGFFLVTWILVVLVWHLKLTVFPQNWVYISQIWVTYSLFCVINSSNVSSNLTVLLFSSKFMFMFSEFQDYSLIIVIYKVKIVRDQDKDIRRARYKLIIDKSPQTKM